jgi:hypothetical protein
MTKNRILSKIILYICSIRKANRIVLRLENSTFKKLNETCLVFNGGLRLRVSFTDGRLQKKLTPQILIIGVFSTNGNAFFSFFISPQHFSTRRILILACSPLSFSSSVFIFTMYLKINLLSEILRNYFFYT